VCAGRFPDPAAMRRPLILEITLNRLHHSENERPPVKLLELNEALLERCRKIQKECERQSNQIKILEQQIKLTNSQSRELMASLGPKAVK
jgi:hypothetical protein